MKFLESVRIGARLAIGFALLLTLIVSVAVMGIVRLQAAGALANEMSSKNMAAERIASAWLTEISVNSTRTVALAKSDDPDVQAFFQQQVEAANRRILDIQTQLEPLIDTDAGRAFLAEIAATREAYVNLGEGVFNKKRGGRHSAAMRMTDEEFLPAVKAYLDSIQRLVTYQQDNTRTLAAEANAHFRHGSIMMASLSVAALVLGALLAWVISRSITQPLNEAVVIAERVAAGDLSTHIVVERHDETGKLLMALREMNTALHTVIGSVRSGTQTIAAASTHIAAGNADLSSRTDAQATSIEQTASAIAALAETVRLNAEHSGQANRLVAATAGAAANGEQAFSEVVGTMSAIKVRAAKIEDIVGVIDGIAMQSNILALNAAVEAARAGIHGRGFAVVAAEVRNLAQRSVGAAREIKLLIEDSLQQVEQGSRLVDNAHEAMDEIVASVNRVAHIMADISAASQEQSDGLQQINMVMSDMDQLTQRNAALVNQAATAASSLQDQAASLAASVSIFKLSGNAGAILVAGQAAHERAANDSAMASAGATFHPARISLTSPVSRARAKLALCQ
ncbi:methyl-accepting chemotaxis protein [Noviherbaspirillum sp. ST9]|uniref:methyl-accepting chemotaxis protein n=1 Tax=Noviherbaspirillum sp. ST9 TaxID=3401606 RepID=UPI003B5876C3